MIRPGDKLFLKYVGSVEVLSVEEDLIKINVSRRGVLPFRFRELGRSLFFHEDHIEKQFSTWNEYFEFNEKDCECREKARLKHEQEEKDRLARQKKEEAARIEREEKERLEAIDKIRRGKEKRGKAEREEWAAMGFESALSPLLDDFTIPTERSKEFIRNEKLKIKAIIENRSIKQLLHFTRTKNLKSIKKHGILPISVMRDRRIQFDQNDYFRYDYRRDCISLSISKVNEPVLRSYSKKYNVTNWEVIAIDPKVILDDKATPFFCFTNAANHIIANDLNDALDPYKLSNAKAFKGMFKDPIRYPIRIDGEVQERICHRFNKMRNEPTDIQAEIMLQGKIDTKYILRYWSYKF